MILFLLPGLNTSKAILMIKSWDWFIVEKKLVIENPKQENLQFFDFLSTINIKQITDLLICNWPWRFMSLRLFITFANTLKNESSLNLYSVPTYEFLSAQAGKECHILLQLNQTEVFRYYDWTTSVLDFEDLDKKSKHLWYWNIRNKLKLPDNYLELELEKQSSSWSETSIIANFIDQKYLVDNVDAFYWKD